MSLTRTRLASSAVLTCAAFAVALAGCTSDQSEPAGIGNVDMSVTLATPPSGPNEQIDDIFVSLYCDGIDPVLGVPRPPQSTPEEFTINVATTEGSEPYNTFGFFEKQGLPAGKCTFTFLAESNTGNTTCTGKLEVMVATDATTDGEVVLACIHTPRYGGVRGDGSFNQCAEYRQILVTPTTQSIGNLVDVRTEVYDPDGDDVTVEVTTTGVCGNVATDGSDEAASCGANISGCEAVVNTVQCTDVGMCQIIVRVSDDEFQSCTGFLPDASNSNNNAARSIIDVDCEAARACGDGEPDDGEECDPPDGVFCDDNCQLIDNCSPDPCNQDNVCSPEVCTADPGDNSAICTPDPGSAAGNACSPPAGGTCDGAGNCVACTVDSECEDSNECTDNLCVAGVCEFPADDTNTCSDGGFPGSCNAGVCEGLCTPDPCTSTVACVTEVCDPANGSCTPQNDGINTGCDLGGGPGSGVCDGQGTCVECNIDAQCDEAAGETCNAGVCEAPVIVCEYEQDFEALDPAAGNALSGDEWLYFANVYDGTVDPPAFKFNFGQTFPAPTTSGQISSIATGEGGTDQGDNQLNIFSNYDCCQDAGPEGHFNGTDLVETIVFQEINPIPADFIGQTFTFQFDAKRGNIGGSTTAQAFIKTIVGSDTTNNIVLDTTALPTDPAWATYTVTIDLTDVPVGAILQFGFQTLAKNFESAGNFYDNITFGLEGCGGDDNGGGGVSGDIAINGGFETGQFNDGNENASWQQFPGGGIQAITPVNPSAGTFAANLNVPVRVVGDPGVDNLIKNANLQAGNLTPGGSITVSFDMRGSLTGAGGVVFAELFSELAEGGTSKSEILGGGAPLAPNAAWTTYNYTTTLGPDVAGGVTLQLKVGCGAVAGCGADVYFDNVSITVP